LRGHIVLDREGMQLPRKGTQSPNYRPASIVAKGLPISATVEHLYKQSPKNVTEAIDNILDLNDRGISLRPVFLICLLQYVTLRSVHCCN